MTNDRYDNIRETFNGKRILITGGAGYLAFALVSLLQHTDCHITRLDRQDAGWEPVTGAAQIRNVCGDVSDPTIWEQVIDGIDFIFHFAAQTSTYTANDNPRADQAINVLPMLHLLEACRWRISCPTVCFSSTVTVAGIPECLPVNESHPDHPLTVYDLHKQMAEQYLRWYAEQGFVRGVILRLANVYGPGPSSSRSDRGILNQMIRRARTGEPMTVYGTGDQVRDYVYVDDVAHAFVCAARHAEKLNGNYYVIGSGQGYTIADAMRIIAERAEKNTGRKAVVQHIDPPGTLSAIEERNFVADSGRFTTITGWCPHVALAEGIDKTLEAYS